MSEVLLADLREWAESYDAVEIGADGVLYMAIHHLEKLIERNKELEAALHAIACSTEPGAWRHGTYEQLSDSIFDCAHSALGEKKSGD